MYALKAVVCHYGNHYVTFVRHSKSCADKGMASLEQVVDDDMWSQFDDTYITPIGSWQDVVCKCWRGALSPTVFTFERIHG